MDGERERIDYILADPEGNKTILVLSPVDRSDYQKIAQLLLQDCPEAEQVGFVKGAVEYEGTGMPHMEMCGLEFCGNATRAFAYYEAQLQDPPLEEIEVLVSGSDKPLKAWIDSEDGSAKIQMPVPVGMRRISIPVHRDGDPDDHDFEITGNLVEMEGIAHLVLTDVEPTEEIFLSIRDHVYENIEDYPAFGVMFMDIASDMLTPVVYVRDVDTVYFAGSCASGTVAAAYSLTATCCVPVRTHVFREPEGTLSVEVHVGSGKINKMLLEGGVGLSGVRTAEIQIV